MDKDMKKLIKALESQGFEIRITTKGHVTVGIDGKLVATLAGTGSDWRGGRNALSRLKRAGFRPPGDR